MGYTTDTSDFIVLHSFVYIYDCLRLTLMFTTYMHSLTYASMFPSFSAARVVCFCSAMRLFRSTTDLGCLITSDADLLDIVYHTSASLSLRTLVIGTARRTDIVNVSFHAHTLVHLTFSLISCCRYVVYCRFNSVIDHCRFIRTSSSILT